MKKRLTYFLIITLILLAGFYLLLLKAFPKTASYYPGFLFLAAIDLYFWSSARKRIHKFRQPLRKVLSFLYWLPLIILVGYLMLTFFIGQKELLSRFASYLIGTILIIYVSKLLPVVLLFLADLLRIVRRSVDGFKILMAGNNPALARKIPQNRHVQSIAWWLGVFILCMFISGMVFWANDFIVRKQEITIKNLSPVYKNMTIVQISDLHLGSWCSEKSLRRVVNMVNSLKPDIVFFTGDLVNNITDEAYPFEPILKRLQAPYGVFAILGNHDYGDYIGWKTPQEKEKNLQDLVDLYNRIGWRLLRNEHVIIEKDSARIAVIGVDNWGSLDRFPKRADMHKALEGMELQPLNILLSHDPSHWEYIISKEYPELQITLAGHTHGFQFGIETKHLRWSPVQWVYKYWAGIYSSTNGAGQEQYLYVNRGLGNIGYPGRIGILPEITVFQIN
jgi:predicted MPP superfamily phosphohydrolase